MAERKHGNNEMFKGDVGHDDPANPGHRRFARRTIVKIIERPSEDALEVEQDPSTRGCAAWKIAAGFSRTREQSRRSFTVSPQPAGNSGVRPAAGARWRERLLW